MSKDRPQGSIEGVRLERFGWQPGDKVQYFDEADNPISLREWQRRICEASERRARDR